MRKDHGGPFQDRKTGETQEVVATAPHRMFALHRGPRGFVARCRWKRAIKRCAPSKELFGGAIDPRTSAQLEESATDGLCRPVFFRPPSESRVTPARWRKRPAFASVPATPAGRAAAPGKSGPAEFPETDRAAGPPVTKTEAPARPESRSKNQRSGGLGSRPSSSSIAQSTRRDDCGRHGACSPTLTDRGSRSRRGLSKVASGQAS